MNKKETDKIIYSWWAERFGITPDALLNPGTNVLFEPALDEDGRVILYEISDAAVIRTGPLTAGRLKLASGLSSETLTAGGFAGRCRTAGIELSIKPVLLDHYLYRENFHSFAPPEGYMAGLIDPEKKEDLAALKKLYSSCTEEELDEADIYPDEHDPVIFGLFAGNELAAYTSYRLWGDSIADMGVLIHPAHRQKTLGKAATSVLCEYCFKRGVVPMARIFDYHEYSLRVPRALGFKPLVLVHSFSV